MGVRSFWPCRNDRLCIAALEEQALPRKPNPRMESKQFPEGSCLGRGEDEGSGRW